MKWTEALLDLLYPPRCAWCGKVGVKGACEPCTRTLPRRERALREGPPAGRCASPLRYDGAVREGMLRFKFHGAQQSAGVFGEIMAQCAAEEYAGAFDTVTWVPVSEKRRRQRGYDQAELLARETARHWDTEPVRLLRKTRDNPAQSGLSSADERRANVLGVYEAADPQRTAGARILLIDDILTTGSTLGECVRVLRDAGAKDVMCLTLAARSEEKKKKTPGNAG